MTLIIRLDDLADPAVRELIVLHHREMHGASPPGTAFALDVEGLRRPGTTVWTAWNADGLAGIGALNRLGPAHAEIKSMRTHPARLRRGIAAAMLDHLIAQARREGLTHLSLETGTSALFDPAIALYRSRDFIEGEAFGDYEASPYNRFFHRDL